LFCQLFAFTNLAPELQTLSSESEATQKLYGLDNPRTANFGRQCLMARRFAERGVRFIQCTRSYKWDQHGNLKIDHARNNEEVNQLIAAFRPSAARIPIAHLPCDECASSHTTKQIREIYQLREGIRDGSHPTDV
jgi:hypothetical protein